MTIKQNESNLVKNWSWKDDIVMATFIAWFPILLLLISVFGEERVYRAHCKLTSHRWADDYRYGVESVCIDCGKERGEH